MQVTDTTTAILAQPLLCSVISRQLERLPRQSWQGQYNNRWAGPILSSVLHYTMLPKLILTLSLISLWPRLPLVQAASRLTAAEDVAAQYSLTTSTQIPFPTTTLSSSDAQTFIETLSNGWSLSKGQIQNNPGNTAFVTDPFPNSPIPGLASINNSGPVLQVTYPQGSLHDDGGTQLYSLWNTTDGSSFNSMLLSYELAFDEGFNWVKGGKLPGLRGGPDPDGCSGGNEPNGTDCFSTRLMWRKNGAGEGMRFVQVLRGYHWLNVLIT